jgi:HEAT repeat protein
MSEPVTPDPPATTEPTPKPKRAGLALLTVLVVGVAIVLIEPTGVVRGKMLGETFFASRPVSYWERQLLAGPAERSAARQTFLDGGPQAVPVLVEMLRTSASAEVRWSAADYLGRLGPDASDASEALLAALDDPDPHVQSVAVEAIPKVGTPADTAVPALAELLDTAHAPVAAYAISVYKARAQAALPQLTQLLSDTSQSADARWNAARTIGKTGPPAIDALPVLIEMTRDSEATVRGNATEAIGDIGPTAVEGVPALIAALDDPVPTVRQNAVRALGYIGPPASEAVDAIKPLLEDPEEKVKTEAQAALQAIAPEDTPAAADADP